MDLSKLGLPPDVRPEWVRSESLVPVPACHGRCPSHDASGACLKHRPGGSVRVCLEWCAPAVEAMARAIPGFLEPAPEPVAQLLREARIAAAKLREIDCEIHAQGLELAIQAAGGEPGCPECRNGDCGCPAPTRCAEHARAEPCSYQCTEGA